MAKRPGFWRANLANLLTGSLTVLLGLVMMMEGSVFSAAGFARRAGGGCSGWTPALGLLHNGADLAIFFAYLAIPLVLLRFGAIRKDLPGRYHWILMSFVGFIFACSITHLLSVVTYYWPAYRLDGAVKVATALLSWTTVAALTRILPEALAARGNVAQMIDVGRLREAEGELLNASLAFRSAVAAVQGPAPWTAPPAPGGPGGKDA